ncbi:LLM class flavin-dependent oxidoreductase [Nocardia sp. NPDC058114]|uniref:LLM class flavin-dependent oxidoreductase n=1 Tax=Nocardia sp. NPDC058114 TaxID=3346346 RepID=UPI0036DF40A3
MTVIRRVWPNDWQLWRSLRLAALADSPDAFDSRLADWQGDGDNEQRWRNRLRSVEANFVAVTASETVGMISGVHGADAREIELISLWVAPSARGLGLGTDLIRAVMDWAATDPSAERVVLRVHKRNVRAQELYRRNGFRLVGSVSASNLEMSHPLRKRIRIGLHSGQQYTDFESMRSLWRDAEQLGYDWISVFDHYRPPIFGPDGPCMDGPSILAALAAVTPRVQCALLVASPVWRHPAVAATIAATIDQVSGGRLEFGVGVGGSDLAHEQFGIAQPTLRARYQQLDETCRILRLLWDGGPVEFSGQHYLLRDAFLNPRPVQRNVPLIIGGAGEKQTLPLVAAHADTWNSLPLSPPVYAHKTHVLEKLCSEIGRDKQVRQSLTFRAVIRPSAQHASQERDKLGSSARRADLPEYVSFGTAAECLDTLAPYVELGVRDFLLGARPPVDLETVERFALEVAPVLRALAAS